MYIQSVLRNTSTYVVRKMPLKFCANLSFMFQETSSILERYERAKAGGFKAVECAFLYSYTVDEVVKVKQSSGLEQVLINSPPGNVDKGELGFAAIPGKEENFKSSIKTAIQYAKALNCTQIHVMAGTVDNVTEDNFLTYEKNLQYAVNLFEKENIIGLIEPINQYSVPRYFLNSFDKGEEIIKKINSPHLKLQLDIFHLQFIKGNLTKTIEKLLPYVGHIQIAQVPQRNEPDTDGEINFNYIFSLLDKLGYNGWIGLEYKPISATEDGLKWIKNFGFTL